MHSPSYARKADELDEGLAVFHILLPPMLTSSIPSGMPGLRISTGERLIPCSMVIQIIGLVN